MEQLLSGTETTAHSALTKQQLAIIGAKKAAAKKAAVMNDQDGASMAKSATMASKKTFFVNLEPHEDGSKNTLAFDLSTPQGTAEYNAFKAKVLKDPSQFTLSNGEPITSQAGKRALYLGELMSQGVERSVAVEKATLAYPSS